MLTQNPTFIKSNVSQHEYNMYKYVCDLGLSFVPKFISYDEVNKTMKMQRIPNMCISDMYGERFTDVPERIIQEIKNIISILYNHGIVYPDITGYNFIEDNDLNIWIIDFEHAFFNNSLNNSNKSDYLRFVEKFINGSKKSWNPEFD